MAFNVPPILNTFMPQNLPGTGGGTSVGLLPMIRDGKTVNERESLLPMIRDRKPIGGREKKLSQFFRPGNVSPGQTTPRDAPGKSSQVQTSGVSVPMTAADLKALNPNWTGRNTSSHRTSTEQMALVGSSLVKSGLVQQTQGTSDVLTKNLTLAQGIVIPAGSRVSGNALPRTLSQPQNSLGESSKNLTFTLPNGNAVKLASTQEDSSGRGATSVEFLDSNRNSLGKAQFVSTLFADTKNGALRFLTQGDAKSFRLSDMRAQATSSEARRNEASDSFKSEYMSKDQLRSAVEKVGLGSL
jgi:hypothetical protein